MIANPNMQEAPCAASLEDKFDVDIDFPIIADLDMKVANPPPTGSRVIK